MDNPTIDFGKYKGRKVSEVPASYLLWMLENATLSEYGRKCVKLNLCEKLEIKASFASDVEQTSEQADYASIYKKLAKMYHPDRIGGNTEAMQAINEFYQLLKNK